MRHCNRCDISYTGDVDRCALCGNELSGNIAPSPFPDIPIATTKNRAKTWLAVGTLLLLAVVIWLCWWHQVRVNAYIAASAAVILNYIFVRNVVVHSPNFLRVIQRYFLLIMALVVLWVIGSRSTDVATYVVPSVSLAAIIFDGVLLAVLRSRMISGYGKYLMYDIAFGGVPLILMTCGMVTWPALSIISACCAGAFAICLFALARRYVTDEAKRLFNA